MKFHEICVYKNKQAKIKQNIIIRGGENPDQQTQTRKNLPQYFFIVFYLLVNEQFKKRETLTAVTYHK